MSDTATPDTVFPAGPRFRHPLISYWKFRRDPTGFLTRLARQYGDVVYFKLAGRDTFLLSHPDFVRDVLVTHDRSFIKSRGLQQARWLLGNGLLTSEGELHRRQRRLIQPLFHRQQIGRYADTMATYTDRLTGPACWQDGAMVDIHQEMMRLTLAIVGKCIFNQDIEAEASEIGACMDILTRNFQRMLLPFSDWLMRLPTAENRRIRQAAATLDRIVLGLIQERRQAQANPDQAEDLLSLLLAARDVEGDGGGMDDRQVRDEALTLLLAGHETTANALTWTWYLLSQYPEVQTRLQAEVDRVLGGRLPTADDVAALAYTRMVLAEAMRLYPPAWIMGREAREDVEIGGYRIPAGSTVLVSQWVIHRDPRYYPEPERFDPMRWTAEAQAGRPRYAYFPFGGGSRICIGEHFAWLEGILILATVARHWQLEMASPRPPQPQATITLRPRHGLPMVLRRRVETPVAALAK